MGKPAACATKPTSPVPIRTGGVRSVGTRITRGPCPAVWETLRQGTTSTPRWPRRGRRSARSARVWVSCRWGTDMSAQEQTRASRLRGLAHFLGARLTLEDTWILSQLPRSLTDIGYPNLDLHLPTNWYKCSPRGGLDEVEHILLLMLPEVILMARTRAGGASSVPNSTQAHPFPHHLSHVQAGMRLHRTFPFPRLSGGHVELHV